MFSIQERLAIPTEPIAGAAWQWMCMLRVATVGKVVSFDAVAQTCIVQPVTQETVLLPPPPTPQNSSPGVTQNIPTAVSIAPIQDVPIAMMRVPGWSMTLPITEGTECLLIHPDTCIDGWWQSGQISPQLDRRRHDLSDSIAFFGPWSQPNVLDSYSTNSMQLRSDDLSVVIDLAPGKITITAPTVDVNATGAINATAPAVKAIASGGTAQPLMTQAFLTYWETSILPFLTSKGYMGPPPPNNSLTTVLQAQ
jgi:hypothetical protein